MALMDWFNSVWQNSGLAPLWDTVAPWLALDERQLIFMVATPFFIGVFLWEFLKIRHDATLVDSRESIRNFMLGAGYQTTELLFAGLIAFPVYAFAYHHRLLDIELTWLTGALLWVLTDFCFYWMHRTSPGALVLGRPCDPPLLRADELLHGHASERYQYLQWWLVVLRATGFCRLQPGVDRGLLCAVTGLPVLYPHHPGEATASGHRICVQHAQPPPGPSWSQPGLYRH